MTEAYDGRQIVGMDLHRRRSVLVRMTEDGRRLETARITNGAAELRREIAKAGQHPKVVLEATYGWYWAADALAEAGAEVHLAHPLGVKAFTYRRVKNDEKDAADLADLLRMGRLPEAWIAPAEIRELRELTRYRIKLVGLRSQRQGPGARGAGQARRPGHLHRPVRRLGQHLAGRPAPAAAVRGQGRLAAAADRRLAGEIAVLDTVIADLLEHHDGYRALQAAARHRAGAGGGDRGRDRRHHPVRLSCPAVPAGPG